MAYKLIEAAQTRWRKVNAPEFVALVRLGALFHKGKLLERPPRHHPGIADRRSRHHPNGGRLKTYRSAGFDNISAAGSTSS